VQGERGRLAEQAAVAAGQQPRAGQDEAGGVQGVEQSAGFPGGEAELGGAAQHDPLGPGAVEKIEQVGGPGIGEIDEQGTGRVGAELQSVRTAPDTRQTGQQGGAKHHE
jgi:hypothetical protein